MSEPVTGTADPVELRHLAEAWPEDIFPTPPEGRQAKDAAAAYVLRRMAVPHFVACADEIERLRDGIQDIIDRHERPSSTIVSTDFDGNPWPVLVPVAELRALLDAR